MNGLIGFRIELRRCAVTAVLPLIVAVASFTAFAKLPAGDATWPDAQAALGIAIILTGPCLTAFAVLCGARERRRRTAYLRSLSARSTLVVVGIEVAAVAFWSVISFGLAMAAVGVRTAMRVQGGAPSGSLAASQLAAMVLFAVVGFALGRIVAWRLAIPLAGVAAFGGVQMLNVIAFFSPSWMSSLNPGRNYHADIWHHIDVWTPIGRALWFVGLAILVVGALCLAASRGETRRPAAVATTLGAVTAVCGAATVGSQGGELFADDTASTVVMKCFDAPLRVCVNPVHPNALPELESAFGTLKARVTGSAIDFTTATEVQFSGTTPLTSPDIPFVVSQTGSGFAQSIIHQVLGERVLSVCLHGPGGPQGATPASVSLQAEVIGWLTGQPSGDFVGDPAAMKAVQTFRGLDETAKREWLKSHGDGIAHCALTPADFS